MNESREWIFHPLSTWPVLSNGGGLFSWQVGHISVAYFTSVLQNCSELAFVFGFSVKFGPTCLPLFFSHHPLVELLRLRHPTKSSCFLEDIRVPFDCKQKSVLNIKSRRRSMSLYLKRRPYKVILGGIRAKHSASSLKVFICNFCLPCNSSLSWLGTSFFPRVRHLWIRCIAISLISKKLNPIYQIVSEKVSLKKAQNLQRMH